MGVVYLGVAGDGRLVAVKVMRPELANDPEFRARFAREVAVLARVRGARIVRVIEAGTDACGPFLVTEYAAGHSLADQVEAAGPLDAGMLYDLAAGLVGALSVIHAAGVVHRDLKPSNVIMTANGPKVIDFGIAQVLDYGLADPDRHDDRLGRFHGSGAVHGAGRPGRRHLRLGRDRGLCGQRAAAVRHRADRGRDVPDPARAAQHRRGAGRAAVGGGGRPGQRTAGPPGRARDPRPAHGRARRGLRQRADADGAVPRLADDQVPAGPPDVSASPSPATSVQRPPGA